MEEKGGPFSDTQFFWIVELIKNIPTPGKKKDPKTKIVASEVEISTFKKLKRLSGSKIPKDWEWPYLPVG